MSFPEPELTALRLLAHRPDTKMLRSGMLLALREKGLVERQGSSLVVTFRGRVALLDKNSEAPTPLDAA